MSERIREEERIEVRLAEIARQLVIDMCNAAKVDVPFIPDRADFRDAFGPPLTLEILYAQKKEAIFCQGPQQRIEELNHLIYLLEQHVVSQQLEKDLSRLNVKKAK